MATALAQKSCTPCRGGVPPLSREAAKEYHREAPDWALLDDATRLERTYRFKNFGEALGFVERAGTLAEAEFHHPDISFGWATQRCRCAPRRSRACTKTISSWRQSSTTSSRRARHDRC